MSWFTTVNFLPGNCPVLSPNPRQTHSGHRISLGANKRLVSTQPRADLQRTTSPVNSAASAISAKISGSFSQCCPSDFWSMRRSHLAPISILFSRSPSRIRADAGCNHRYRDKPFRPMLVSTTEHRGYSLHN